MTFPLTRHTSPALVALAALLSLAAPALAGSGQYVSLGSYLAT